MKASITDRNVFDSLKPLDLVAYLRSSGWELAGYLGEAATVWRHGAAQVMVPRETYFADYARRLAEVVETLSNVESRSELEIVSDLSMATVDVVRVRITTPQSADGSVSLEQGVNLFDGVKDMLLSAARAAVAPRAYFRSRLPGPADEYMRQVRLGQTERGSYVATLVCPVSPELQPAGSNFAQDVGEPFDRRVTRTLATAMYKTAEAVREAVLRQDMAPFTEAVRDGVSANLCNALAEIGGGVDGGILEVGFSWARTRSRPQVPSSRIMVPNDALPILKEAARVLREIYRDDDFEIIGPVIRLDSSNAAYGGVALVHAEVDTMRKVQVYLDASDYQLAVRAHQEGLEVTGRGRLEKEGRYFTLRKVRDFGLQEQAP
jgi:hypothetical protein